MGLAYSLAETLNIAWGLAADDAKASIKDRLEDLAFRRQVAKAVSSLLDPAAGADAALMRSLLRDPDFFAFVANPYDIELRQRVDDGRLEELLGADQSPGRLDELGRSLAMVVEAAIVDRATPPERLLLAKVGEVPDLATKVDALHSRLGSVGGAIEGLGGRVVLVPPPLGDWGLVGRDEDLVRLHEVLCEHGSAAVVPVTGLGGLGKTALAAGYVAGYGEGYDLIAWVEAERPELIAGQYRRLVRLRTGQDVDETDAVAAAKALLAGPESGLVVFDNATDRDAVEPFLPSGPCRVVVTTRDETWSTRPDKVVSLDPLREQTVVGWLLDALEGDQDEAAIGEIAGRLDGLPLAATQAIAFINARPGESAVTYLARLKDRDGQQLVYAAHRPPGYPAPLATTWDIAIGQLTTEVPAAVELLGALAYIDPDGVPIALCQGRVDHADTPELLYLLRRYGLIRANSTHVTVHRLLQDVTRWSHTSDDTASHIQRWATHLDDVAPDSEDHRNVDWYRDLAPHLIALFDHATEHNQTPNALASVGNKAGISLRTRAAFTTAQAVFERALASFEGAYGPDHPEVARTLNNLGNLYTQVGEYQRARTVLERALAIKEGAYGSDDPEVAITLGNLGVVHIEVGEFQQARTVLERALAIKVVAYGPDHPQAAITLGNLGDVYRQVGEYQQARTVLERALAIEEGAYGPDHPQVAMILTGLGNIYNEVGEHQQARTVLERALAIFEGAYGPDHPQTAVTLTSLGVDYCEFGEHRQAQTVLERALAIDEGVYGPDHPQVAMILTGLGVVYDVVGEHRQARTVLERALAIFEEVYGPDHPQVAITLGHLGVVHGVVGEHRQARTVLERALAIFEEVHGPDHPHTVHARRLLAKWHPPEE